MDVSRIKQDFPALRDGDLVYLDSACQTLRPQCVIDAVTEYYRDYPACGGRSVHRMATRVSVQMDRSREAMAAFLGAKDAQNIIFTKNCTESINLVAKGLSWMKGDVVMTTDLEHNSNHAPWVDLTENIGLKRVIVPTGPGGVFDLDAYQDSFRSQVRLVSMAHTSNVTGTTIPMKEVVEIAHDHGAMVLIDGAQAAPHMPVDVHKTGVDFYALSGHKMLGPSAVGVLYGTDESLESLKPLMLGGGTVGRADYDKVHLAPAPERFEAGLANYSGIIGTGAALDYLSKIGMDNISKHEHRLQRVLQERLDEIEGISLVGPDDPDARSSVFSFNLPGLGSHDVAMMVDEMAAVLIRSGMHCAHPYFYSRGINGCVRASTYIYNDEDDMHRLVDALLKVSKTFCN
ncbi:MAG: cysteine desulfurase [Candidatus Methanomethylophilaceae archaeon]|nr:cysteine desulfurase [Candidatus Methanomethylophilaceae archaeon]